MLKLFLKLDNILILLTALLFSIPDTRILGVSSYSILSIFLVLISLVHLKKFRRSIFDFNKPFFFLILFSIVVSVFYFSSNSFEQNRLILTKNVEILNMLLIVIYVLGIAKKREGRLLNIKLFIEVYFYANLFYLLVKAFYPEIYFIFHQYDSSYVLSSLSTRESLLGYEPSYTGPLTYLLFLIYTSITKRTFSTYIFFFLTVYSFVIFASKTALIMLGIYFIIKLYVLLTRSFKFNKLFSKFLLIIFFSVSSLYTYDYFDNKFGFSNFEMLTKADKYKIISWKTRSELIGISLKIISYNPLGYGYGNSISVISNYVEDNPNDIESFEIEQANWSARSPKSQLLEYISGGGFIFLILFYNMQIKRIFNLAGQRIYENEKFKYLSIFILLLVAISIGERIPYILLSSMVFEILIIKGEYTKKMNLDV